MPGPEVRTRPSRNTLRRPICRSPALTEALRLALSDVSRLRAMGAESYRSVAEEINLEKMVGVFVEVLKRVKV